MSIEVHRNRTTGDPLPSGSAKLGDVLPDAELLYAHGVSVTVAAARASRPAVVVLYRATWAAALGVLTAPSNKTRRIDVRPDHTTRTGVVDIMSAFATLGGRA